MDNTLLNFFSQEGVFFFLREAEPQKLNQEMYLK